MFECHDTAVWFRRRFALADDFGMCRDRVADEDGLRKRGLVKTEIAEATKLGQGLLLRRFEWLFRDS